MGAKGVSPLIATVLLIASVIAIAGIISIWLTSFTRTTTGTVETITTNQTRCAGAYIKIDVASSSMIYYSNPSSQTISNIILVTSDGKTMIPPTQSLTAASMASISWVRGSNTSVMANGLCLSSVPIEGSCLSLQPCWS